MPTIASLVRDLQPFARDLFKIAGMNGLNPRITSARRTYREQLALYDRYRKGFNPFPVAKPGTSAHETGEAFDMLVTPVEYLQDLGSLWISWGGEWGGDRDPVHFQLPGAPSPELLAQTKGSKRARERATKFVDDAGSLVDNLVSPWWSFILPDAVTQPIENFGPGGQLSTAVRVATSIADYFK